MSELKLLPCPFCHAQAKIGYACGDYFVHCSDRCPSPMCDHASESTTVCSWNDWAEWYEKNRRTQPENAEETKCRCPCGEQDDSFCPICTKIRVQAIKEKLDRENPKSLTPDELKQMYGEPVYLHILDTGLKVWAVVMEVSSGGGLLRFNCGQNALIISDYGKTWVAYRRKPERSEG